MDVLVVGAGAMGRWFGRVLLEAGSARVGGVTDVDVSYYDRHPSRAVDAADQTGGTSIATVDDEFDLVCVAVPMPAAVEAIITYAPAARNALVDVTGTMSEPVAAMNAHAPDRERCSLHPLFAPENEPGNVPMVVDDRGEHVAFVENALSARGNHVFETTPAEHDEAMASVQARAHTAVLAYALATEPVPERFETAVSVELGALVEQVTAGDPRVYADIQAAFDGAETVADAARALAESDGDDFEQLYREAATAWTDRCLDVDQADSDRGGR